MRDRLDQMIKKVEKEAANAVILKGGRPCVCLHNGEKKMALYFAGHFFDYSGDNLKGATLYKQESKVIEFTLAIVCCFSIAVLFIVFT